MKFILFVLAAALPLVSGSSTLAQNECRPDPERASVEHGARFSIDRGRGQGRIEIKCSEQDTTRACLDAVSPIISGGSGGVVVFATTSLKCSDATYTISTGNNNGKCGPHGQGQQAVTCTEGTNTVSSASCASGCGTQTGSGSCTIK
jgi:hypothetical protein